MSDAPEVARPQWKKSSRSTSAANCVEVAVLAGAVAMRDSKDPDGPRLMFGPETWRGFVADVRAGSFDRPEGI